MALRICKAVYDILGGQRLQWVSLKRVSEHIKVTDQEMLAGGVSHAAQMGWLLIGGQPAHSLLLTHPGELAALKK